MMRKRETNMEQMGSNSFIIFLLFQFSPQWEEMNEMSDIMMGKSRSLFYIVDANCNNFHELRPCFSILWLGEEKEKRMGES